MRDALPLARASPRTGGQHAMSIIPPREAIRRLSSEGLIIMDTHREFRRAVYAASHHDVMIKLLNDLWDKSDWMPEPGVVEDRHGATTRKTWRHRDGPRHKPEGFGCMVTVLVLSSVSGPLRRFRGPAAQPIRAPQPFSSSSAQPSPSPPPGTDSHMISPLALPRLPSLTQHRRCRSDAP